jgi:hypothetical protein
MRVPRGQSTNAIARRPGTHTSCVTHCKRLCGERRARQRGPGQNHARAEF